MAITSISRLQHRRGLRTDLPANLYEGELGFCLDTRELFIGNGQTYSGNSQLLTQWSQNTKLINYIYKGDTGVDATTGPTGQPTVRSLGGKLDDVVSVKDYGAVGDGVTDDTSAIQRAIADRWAMEPDYPRSASMSKNAIHMPAGTYLISAPISVYPLTSLIGDGIGKTRIVLNNRDQPCMLRTSDNLGEVGANIGMNGAVLPTDMVISGISFHNPSYTETDGIWLQRCSNILMVDCEVSGPWNPTDSTVYNTKAVSLQTLGVLSNTANINLVRCRLSRFVNCFYCNEPASYVSLSGMHMLDSFRGVVIGEASTSNGPSYVRISDSTLSDMRNYGLAVYSSNPGIVSTNNTYHRVGDYDGVPSIYIGNTAKACGSVNDVFSSYDSDNVYIDDPINNIFITPQRTSIASNAPITAGPFTLIDNQINAPIGVSYDVNLYNTIFIQYSIKRGSARRAGTLTIISDGASLTFDDVGIDHNGTTGVTLNVVLSGGKLILNYTTTNLATEGTFSYIETKWFT